MRQHAWLGAVPERAKGEKLDVPRQSRLEQLLADKPGFEPEMPPASAAYLITHLWQVGPSMPSGGYGGPITHQELEAWQRLNAIELQPWESRFLVALSREYVSQLFKSEKRDCKEPMLEELGRGGFAGGGVDAVLVARNLKRMVEEISKL